MTRLARLLVGILVAASTLQSARAACPLAGEVVAGGQSLEGVLIKIREGTQARTIATSDSGGRFSANVPKLGANQVLIVIFEQDGFLGIKQSLDADPETRCPVGFRRPIAMEKEAPETGGADASTLGRTLFISPYALYGDIADTDEKRLNEIVDRVIGHRIRAYSTSLALTPSPPELSVRKLDKPLSMVDRERIRSVGSELRALGVVTGEGELRKSENGDIVFDLFSEFSVIPRHPRYAERRLQVGDTLPRRSAMPIRLSKHLADFWGQKAMIALAVRELVLLQPSTAKEELLRVRSLLIAVRGTMREENPLLEEVEDLLGYVDEELGE